MRFSVASDHAGYHWKEKAKAILERLGHTVVDHGTNSTESVDYPDFASKVAQDVVDGKVDFGVVVCYTGNGVNMTANRFPGVRSALLLTPEMAKFARAHNNANVMALSEHFTPEENIEPIIKTWLETPFEGGRHERRVNKLSAIEREHNPTPAGKS